MDLRGVPGLLPDFPEWLISVHERGTAWTAERRDGTALHVLVAHDLNTLRVKIEKAAGKR